MSNLKIEGLFKGSGKPVEYGEGKKINKFYLDIDTDSQYPSIAEFQFFGDKINLSGINKGDKISVSFNISGRKWEKDGKSGFAQSLNAWKVEKNVESAPANSYSQEPNPPLPTNDGLDDLPF